MKILVISEGKHSTSAIDLWRIWRPMQELAKYVDWQIDYQDRVIEDRMKLPTRNLYQRAWRGGG